eukprot:s2064_g5.t1
MAGPDAKPKSRLRQGFEFAVSVFEFSTPYEVVFKDWRLTLLQAFFTFMVAVYVAVRSVLFWSIVNFDQVATGFNSWCYTSWTSPAVASSPHCGENPIFDLAPQEHRLRLRVELRISLVAEQLGGIEAYNHTCPRVTGAEVMKQVGTEAQVKVWQQLRRNTPGCGPGDLGADGDDDDGGDDGDAADAAAAAAAAADADAASDDDDHDDGDHGHDDDTDDEEEKHMQIMITMTVMVIMMMMVMMMMMTVMMVMMLMMMTMMSMV